MGEVVMLSIILLIILIRLYKTYKPHIDIVYTGTKRYRIVLWYNFFSGPDVKRTFIKLYEKI